MQNNETQQARLLPRPEELCPFLKGVKGFMAPDEGRLLQEAGYAASTLGPCLEIGGYCGLSTIYLGLGIKARGGILFSVDHHQGSEEHQPGEEFFDPELFDPEQRKVDSFKEFRKNISLADLEQTVVPMVCSSEVAARMWSTPLALVFIDGGHSEQAAKTDYRLWANKIMPGGMLAIHDIFFDPDQGGQAPRMIYEEALASGIFSSFKMVNTLALLCCHA